MRVLIVDRDVELAELYCRFLEENGISAESAGDGLECMWKVWQRTPDALILDRELPWGDADGVLACLRQDEMSLPVVLTTWNPSRVAARRFVVPPVVQCLHKFIPLRALLSAVQLAVDSFAVNASDSVSQVVMEERNPMRQWVEGKNRWSSLSLR